MTKPKPKSNPVAEENTISVAAAKASLLNKYQEDVKRCDAEIGAILQRYQCTIIPEITIMGRQIHSRIVITKTNT